MKRYFILLLAISLISISALFYDVKSTFAVSVYDNAYQTTTDPYFRGYYCSEQQDASFWLSLLNSPDTYYVGDQGYEVAEQRREYVMDYVLSAKQNGGGIALSVTPDYAGGIATMYIMPESGGELRFGNLSGSPQYPQYGVYIDSPSPQEVLVVTFGITTTSLSPSPTCAVQAEQTIDARTLGSGISVSFTGGSVNNPWYTQSGLVISRSNERYNYFAENFTVIYPSDYEGQFIVDNDPYDPTPPVEEVPDFYIVQGVDHKIEIADNRYFTFDDPNRTLCQPDDLSPFIQYELKTIDGIIVDSGAFSPTITYSYQWPDKNSEGTYTFTGSYSCGDLDPKFIGETTVTFSMSKDGIYTDDFMATCFIETPPWVDINGCISGMSRAFNLLGFKSLQFGNTVWATFQPQCGQLSNLGHWIHKPNEVLCPIFPAYVRDTVTPFVTFALGLLMLNFVTKHGGTGF